MANPLDQPRTSAPTSAGASRPEAAAGKSGESGLTAGEARPGRLQRIGRLAEAVFRVVRQAPMTLTFVAVLALIGAVSGTTGHQPGNGILGDVGTGAGILSHARWWTLLSYGFWSVSPTALVATCVFALAVGVPAERRLGALRTAGIFALCQIGGALLGWGVIELGAKAGDFWLASIVDDPAVGASVGIVGVGLALSAKLTALWRRRLRLVLLTGSAIAMFYSGNAHDVFRFGGAVLGLTAGMVIWGRAREHHGLAATHAEARNLIALAVATSALGPMFAFLSDSPYGPLAAFSELFADSGPTAQDVADLCVRGEPDFLGRTCLQVRSEQLLANGPAMFSLLVPAVFLLILAEGLRRGRRIALIAAVLAEIGIAAVTWRYAAYAIGQVDALGADTGQIHRSIIVYSVLLVLIPAAVITLLLLTRRHFDLPSPRWTVPRVLGVAAAAFVVCGAAYIKFGYDARGQFAPQPTFAQLVADYPKRLVPPVYLSLFGHHDSQFIPVGNAGKALYEYVGPVFWIVTLGGLLLAFWRPVSRARASDQARARELLVQGGGSTLSYMTTWPGHRYWLSDDATAAVAYRVIGNVAVTTGEPYGREASRAAAVEQFAGYCDHQGWTSCFYSITSEAKETADRLGWSAVQVAEDTVLSLPELEFKGKKWQDVRTALNKAPKAGITAQWWTFPTAPLAVQQQIRELSEEWVADKGLPEMGFTLGGLDELDDPDVRMLIAVDTEGALHGVTSWLPSYRDGKPIGWTLDFMRRGTDSFRGVMEFLIASAALGFKEDGAEFLSLSGAPLARVDQSSPPEGLQRLLDIVGRALEPVYGFRSLLAFKAKFQPRYQPLYMTYPDAAALPAIANAIGRAYLPHTTPGQLMRLSRRLRG